MSDKLVSDIPIKPETFDNKMNFPTEELVDNKLNKLSEQFDAKLSLLSASVDNRFNLLSEQTAAVNTSVIALTSRLADIFQKQGVESVDSEKINGEKNHNFK